MGIFFRRKCPMKRCKWCAPIWGKYSDVKQIHLTWFLMIIVLFIPKLSVQCFVNHWVYCSTFSLWSLYGVDGSRQCRCRIVNLPHSKPSPGMFTISRECLLYSKPFPRILHYLVNIPPGENLLYSKHSPIHRRSSPRIFCYIVNVPP